MKRTPPRPRRCTPTLLAAIACAGFAAQGVAIGQQTIVNVPSDALTPEGKHFLMHESVGLPRKAGEYYNSTNFYTYGLTKRTELAATLYNVNNGGSDDLSLGLGFKSVLPVFRGFAPDLHTKLTLGHMTPLSLRPAPSGAGFFTYGHLAFDVPGTDLRLLAGAAGGSRNIFGKDAASAIAGVEYPLTDHLSFTGEWFSGDHNFSALIPGLTYHKDDWIVVAGLKIPNDFDPKEYGLVLELGKFFGKRKGAGEAHEGEDETEAHYGERRPRRRRLFGFP